MAKLIPLSAEFKLTYSCWVKGIVFSCLLASLNVFAQSYSSPQGLSASDIAALKGANTLQGLGAAGIGSTNLPGMLAISLPSFPLQDEAEPVKDEKKDKKPLPIPPNEFQKYVLQTTGQSLPLYGADFFENLSNNNGQFSRSPVSDDYVIGVGDQLLIRVWGSTSAEASVTVDRQGTISFPKLGVLRLAGVKASQLDAVVKAYFAKFYKDIEVSVTLGKIRKITVFVVGQARNPGSYSLTGQSTLTSAMFASGGPNASGSLRKVQLKRQGQLVAEFDLYSFLGHGDKSKDIKLQDGDVLFYPKAVGYMALLGKVNSPGVFEVKNEKESLSDFLSLAGGLPVLADPKRATLDRILSGSDQPRSVQDINLIDGGSQTYVNDGDVLTVMSLVPELSNAVTLRGAISQPGRFAWKQGMRVSDLIPKKSLLMTSDTVRRQNEVLFDHFEQERTARVRARVPTDLANERVLLDKISNPADKNQQNLPAPNLGGLTKMGEQSTSKSSETGKSPEITDRDVAIAQLGKPFISEESLAERIGQMAEQVNLDYAVVERFSRESLQYTLLPFNLRNVLNSPKGNEDLILEPGDVVTVFSNKDIQIPTSRFKAFVRVEGEVNRPGIYPVEPGDNLKTMIQKAGGTTAEAYLFATGLFREEVKKSQLRNMEKLLRKMEAESSATVAQISQSGGASADPAALQAKVQSVQQAQRQSLDRFRMLKPEGRISLGISPSMNVTTDNFPNLRLENGDKIHIPPRPDFIQIFGSVNTEAALVYRAGLSVKDYIAMAGIGSSADLNGAILVRADGSAMTNQSYWGNDVLSAQVLPGDTIVMPEKFDRESSWSQTVRNAKDFTQVLYQLGLGAAAIKTLRQ